MTIKSIDTAIANLIVKRAKAHGDTIEQRRINNKLTMLYDLKYLAIDQKIKYGC